MSRASRKSKQKKKKYNKSLCKSKIPRKRMTLKHYRKSRRKYNQVMRAVNRLKRNLLSRPWYEVKKQRA